MSRVKNIIKRTAQKTKLYNNNWTLPPVARSNNKDMERTLDELKQIANVIFEKGVKCCRRN